jgi:hypothetical protein
MKNSISLQPDDDDVATNLYDYSVAVHMMLLEPAE